MGLRFHCGALSEIDDNTGEILFYLFFDGDTKPHKEKLKKLGYHFEEDRAHFLLDLRKPKKVWGKVVGENVLKEEFKLVEETGAKFEFNPGNIWAGFTYGLALKAKEEWQEKQEKLAALEKPVKPEILGKKSWNGKFYGRKGSYNIYLDGEKTSVSDELARELERWVEEMEIYRGKRREILGREILGE